MADENEQEVEPVDETETPADPLTTATPAGVDEGTVLTTVTAEGEKSDETIRHDTDEEGNLLGWSKVPEVPPAPEPEGEEQPEEEGDE